MSTFAFIVGLFLGSALGLLVASLAAAARDYDEPLVDDWTIHKDDTDWRREVLEARIRRLDRES